VYACLGTYVRGEQVLRLEDAVRRTTSPSAPVLRVPIGARLDTGAWTDVSLLTRQVAGIATFHHLQQYPSGVEFVLVNGDLVVDHGEHTGACPGGVIRGPSLANKPHAVSFIMTIRPAMGGFITEL
jgi:N-acyl-D-amino-acid deacylase